MIKPETLPVHRWIIASWLLGASGVQTATIRYLPLARTRDAWFGRGLRVGRKEHPAGHLDAVARTMGLVRPGTKIKRENKP